MRETGRDTFRPSKGSRSQSTFMPGIGCWYHHTNGHSAGQCFYLLRMRERGVKIEPPNYIVQASPSVNINSFGKRPQPVECELCHQQHELQACSFFAEAKAKAEKRAKTSTNNTQAHATDITSKSNTDHNDYHGSNQANTDQSDDAILPW